LVGFDVTGASLGDVVVGWLLGTLVGDDEVGASLGDVVVGWLVGTLVGVEVVGAKVGNVVGSLLGTSVGRVVVGTWVGEEKVGLKLGFGVAGGIWQLVPENPLMHWHCRPFTLLAAGGGRSTHSAWVPSLSHGKSTQASNSTQP
jgi:hypothetical protein